MNQKHQKKKTVSVRRRKKYKKKKRIMLICLMLITAGAALMGILKIRNVGSLWAASGTDGEPADYSSIRPEMTVALLTPNVYSRPQTPLEKVNGIVIHYTANPGSTAMNNRDYFEGLKDSCENYVSSHFVVGIDGEIVQCIPTSEIAYASNSRNSDTISVEVCHLDESGAFTQETYDALVELTGWLCLYLDVPPENVIRHYDVTGKICPKYYVEHEDAWEAFKKDVAKWAKKRKS